MLTGRPYTAAFLFPVLRAGRLSVGRPAGRMRLTNGNHADHQGTINGHSQRHHREAV